MWRLNQSLHGLKSSLPLSVWWLVWVRLTPDVANQIPDVRLAKAEQLHLEFVSDAELPVVEDSFFRWLSDDRSVRIDWSTFGIEKNAASIIGLTQTIICCWWTNVLTPGSVMLAS